MDSNFSNFMETDYMMKDLYHEYITDGKFPSEEEVKDWLRFFCTFAIGCSKVGLVELGKTFSMRADCYVVLLQRIGYKYGRSFCKGKLPGLHELIAKALYDVGVE